MCDNEYYTAQEIIGFLSDISDDDSAYLMNLAKKWWYLANLRESRDGSAHDILHQALMLTLSCRHQWKRTIDLRGHFSWVIKHVAGKWAGKGLEATQGAERLLERETSEERIAVHASPVYDLVCEEDVLAYARKRYFSDDESAWNVLESRMRGDGKRIIMKRFGLDETQYKTILKRIRRKLKTTGNGENYELR